MKQKAQQGLSLIELLVVMVMASVLGLLLVRLIGSSQDIRVMQQQRDTLQQNSAVMAQVLQLNLPRAGYLGGAPEDFTGTGWTAVAQATALQWLINNKTPLRASNVSLKTLQGTNNTTAPDDVTSVYLQDIQLMPGNQYRYTFRRVGLGVDTQVTETPMRYNEQRVQCDVNPSFNTASCTTGASNPQPMLDGIEDFQVFYQQKSSQAWVAAQPAANNFRAIGVYVRFRVPSPRTTCKTPVLYPSKAVVLPATATALDIPTTSYSGTACRFQRLERVYTFLPISPQDY